MNSNEGLTRYAITVLANTIAVALSSCSSCAFMLQGLCSVFTFMVIEAVGWLTIMYACDNRNITI